MQSRSIQFRLEQYVRRRRNAQETKNCWNLWMFCTFLPQVQVTSREWSIRCFSHINLSNSSHVLYIILASIFVWEAVWGHWDCILALVPYDSWIWQQLPTVWRCCWHCSRRSGNRWPSISFQNPFNGRGRPCEVGDYRFRSQFRTIPWHHNDINVAINSIAAANVASLELAAIVSAISDYMDYEYSFIIKAVECHLNFVLQCIVV